jgi:hypothetical protein
MSKKLITTISTVSTLAAVSVAVPVATAAGPPPGGGGCHMVSSPSPSTNMMDGSAHGAGAANMAEMLSRFSCGT